jgi:sulfofructose kinase
VPADSRAPRITGLGVTTLDYLFVAPRAATGRQAVVHDYAVAGGGLVGTALVAAARLGADAAIRTWVGDDAAGEAVVKGLWEDGVDTSGVEVLLGERTLVCFIHVNADDGDRTIYCPRLLTVPREVQLAAAARPLDCDALLVDAVWPEASLVIARAAQAQRIPVIGDFSPGPGLEELAGLMTALIVPGAGSERLAPGADYATRLGMLRDLGAEFVAITAGDEGCYFLDGTKVCHQPPFPVSVVDTTGAGDVFHGAFAYALARRRPLPLAVEFASAVAALSCRALGGRGGIPALDEALDFLKWHGSDRWL